MKTRIFQTKLWKDSYYQGLNDKEKLLFMYYLFNENISIIHLYEAPDWETMAVNKATLEELTNAKNKFQADGKLHFKGEWVFIPNAYKYQEYKGDTNEKAKATLWRQIPKHVLDWFYSINDTTMDTTQILSESKTKTKVKTEIESIQGEVAEGYLFKGNTAVKVDKIGRN